ncbi:hypothetical protein [Enterovibrio norvegicus]|uniref:hypothetical protein n=1 Tax=Enterovibrio norvegicus TaxID=188144 RepID=UPI000C85CC64|nr:hypothetical protein [Enterovibrio norvegicus]PML77346.1 hypothetical protein BCT69_20115 [Enterovibrio norvegicus]PMN70661.1 hypothetical protein BCT27_02820 [Enterovibrio norvegicus]
MQKRNSLIDWLSVSLVLAMVTSGVYLRTDAVISPNALHGQTPNPAFPHQGQPRFNQGFYQEGSAEKQLVRFFRSQGLFNVKSVHFTEDAGIKGLQVSVPSCGGYLAMLVMPDGDELAGLWQTLAERSQYRTQFLFDGTLYNEFPRAVFWLKTTVHAVARKVGAHTVFYPGPALAIAHPERCARADQLPFNHIALKGGIL